MLDLLVRSVYLKAHCIPVSSPYAVYRSSISSDFKSWKTELFCMERAVLALVRKVTRQVEIRDDKWLMQV